MYQLDWIQRRRVLNERAAPAENSLLSVDANVWRLGFTSFFTDISSEMVSAILPLYFVAHLQFSPLQYGVLDGIYQGGAVAILGLVAGICADRWRRQKEVAAAGYGFSALSKLALLFAGGHWGWVAGTLTLDRVGKGIRTAPRDAMISLCSRPRALATAFAVHRALDAGGAVFGPLVAYLLLRALPGDFDLVLMTSFCVGLVGLGLISLLVEKPPELKEAPAAPTVSISMGLWKHKRLLPFLIASGLLSLVTASDGFIYLLLQKRTNSPSTVIPLFAFLTAIFYVLLSIPAGRLADRYGRRRMFLAGYSLVILIYVILLTPGIGVETPLAILGMLGGYYAATDGVLAAMASATLTPNLRASGLATLNTVISVARFGSSVLFGWLWVARNENAPVWVFLAGLCAAMLVSVTVLKDRKSA